MYSFTMTNDPFPPPDPEDRIQFDKRMKREGRTDSFDSYPPKVKTLGEALMQYNWIRKIVEFVTVSLVILCFLIALFILGYMVYLWVGILKTLSFLELAISIGLFFITIPVAPIYLGFLGDWWPAIYILLSFLILIIFISVYFWFCDSTSSAYFEKRDEK
jgi:hypothetical protein